MFLRAINLKRQIGQIVLCGSQAREVQLKPDPHSGKLNAQKNVQDHPNRPIILDRSFSGMAVRTLLRSVHYGTSITGTPLCLIAFEVLFIFPTSATLRFTNASITASFTRTPDKLIVSSPTDVSVLTPILVKNFCPRKFFGAVQHENRKWIYRLDVPLNLTPPFAQTGINPSVSMESSFIRDYRMEVRGLPIANNTVKWTLVENAKQKEGIPDIFTCALLVEHDGNPFQADVSVSVRPGVALPSIRLDALPWSKDDPVLFHPGMEFAVKLSHRRLDQLDETEWLSLVDFPVEYQVRASRLSTNCHYNRFIEPNNLCVRTTPVDPRLVAEDRSQNLRNTLNDCSLESNRLRICTGCGLFSFFLVCFACCGLLY